MAHGVVFAPEARAPLVSTYSYIASQASAAVALAFTASIVDYCESFKRFPNRGTRRSDLRPGLRTIGFRRRVAIAFEIEGEIVSILSIFYGGQDVADALRRGADE